MRPTAVPPATGHPALADDGPAGRLFGVWRLTSCRARLSGETGPRDLFGPNPFGYIIFTPERRMMTFISRRDRRPPTHDAEAAALLRSMLAYTGRFRMEDDRVIVSVDGAWSEVSRRRSRSGTSPWMATCSPSGPRTPDPGAAERRRAGADDRQHIGLRAGAVRPAEGSASITRTALGTVPWATEFRWRT
jgi:hypothetical protein